MIRQLTLTLLIALLCACAGSDDASARFLIGASIANVADTVDSRVAVQLAFPDPAAPIVSGTRDSFTVAGSVDNPWHDGAPAGVTGSGGTTGTDATHVSFTLAIHIDDWHDDLWKQRFQGDLHITELVTYAADTDPLPTTATTHIAADLDLGAVELDICAGNLLDVEHSTYGWSGTIDGEPAHDGTCP